MFVSFEGIEGAGKTCALKVLADHLQRQGLDPLVTREPGGTYLGRGLRSILLDARTRHLSPRAELFLFLADRAQHVAEVIVPALEAGQIVLCDRYVDSTLAYQGHGRGIDVEWLRTACLSATDGLMPDLTLLLDLPVNCGLGRAGQRNREEGTVISEGRFDAESIRFHEQVRQGYRILAEEEPDRIAVVDASQPLDDVGMQCISAFTKCQQRMGRG
ncbi:MAG: dTMP kinase [Desulfovibrio sp.]|jgi:dTMP kinase|nr:dTMP kinase [Desulfovibrio sp.]